MFLFGLITKINELKTNVNMQYFVIGGHLSKRRVGLTVNSHHSSATEIYYFKKMAQKYVFFYFYLVPHP